MGLDLDAVGKEATKGKGKREAMYGGTEIQGEQVGIGLEIVILFGSM